MNCSPFGKDRKSTRLNSSHTEIYTLSLHDALPIFAALTENRLRRRHHHARRELEDLAPVHLDELLPVRERSEEHTSELQSHRDLHSFPTRRSSDLCRTDRESPPPTSPSRASRT